MPRSMIRLYKHLLKDRFGVEKVFLGYTSLLVWVSPGEGYMHIRVGVPHPRKEKAK